MLFMFIISIVIFAYELLSLVLPLKIPVYLKILIALILLIASFKNYLFQKFGGGMFFAPDLPRDIVLIGACLYNFLIVALFLLIIKDVIFLICKLCGISFSVNFASSLVIIISIFLTAYGTYEAIRIPDVETHEVKIKNLHDDFDGFKAVMLVDLHVSALNKKSLIEGIVEKTNNLNPDVILIPGDFVDGLVSQRKYDLEPLKNLRAKFGVFATSGNHEYYSGYIEWLNVLEGFGIKFLENKNIVLTSGDAKLIIAGVPDSQGIAFNFPAPDVKKALNNMPENTPIILMDHRPGNAKINSENGVDLQISGHTHGGMIPILDKIVANFNNGFVKGWYEIGKMKLYVSKGTSLWNGFPMRILDPAEITLFILRK